MTTTVTLDWAGRVSTAVMGNGLSVSYDYLANGLTEYAVYGNGTQTHYQYDAAQRLIEMTHEVTASGLAFKILEYDYYDNGLLKEIHEPAPQIVLRVVVPGPWEKTEFFYDNRGRLIRDWRHGADQYSFWNVYDLLYTYDQVGNRLSKTDVWGFKEVTYTYDVSDPGTNGSCSNRLGDSREEVPNEHRRR